MKRRIFQVDAFTQEPFGGNPAGVMPEAEGLDAGQMQVMAKEMNLSETAFVLPGGEDYDFELRFFTPVEEVDLCGHATIATFHLLRELGLLPVGRTTLRQKTLAGVLDIAIGEDGSIRMLQAAPRQLLVLKDSTRLAEVMGCAPSDIGIPGVLELPEVWTTGLPDILMPVRSQAALQALAPDMETLTALSRELGVTGVHAFAVWEGMDVLCRNFAPACGIPEEAATGTSNGALGACLFHHGRSEGGGLHFVAGQGQWMGRPSRISVSIREGAVWVGGHAVTVLSGEMIVPRMPVDTID